MTIERTLTEVQEALVDAHMTINKLRQTVRQLRFYIVWTSSTGLEYDGEMGSIGDDLDEIGQFVMIEKNLRNSPPYYATFADSADAVLNEHQPLDYDLITIYDLDNDIEYEIERRAVAVHRPT